MLVEEDVVRLQVAVQHAFLGEKRETIRQLRQPHDHLRLGRQRITRAHLRKRLQCLCEYHVPPSAKAGARQTLTVR